MSRSSFPSTFPSRGLAAAFLFGAALYGGSVATAQSKSGGKPVAGATQETDNDPAKQWRTVVVPSTYKLGPGDVLNLRVERFSQYSYSEVMVTPDGKFTLPVYGEVKVVNRTLPEVEAELRKRLGTRLVHPELLSLGLEKPRTAAVYSVYMLGAGVKTQGATEIQLNYRLSEALAKAGGLMARPEEINATLTRANKPPVPLDLKSAIEQSSGPANIRVLPNDVLTFTPVDIQSITVDGDIARPGTYTLRRFPTPGGNELSLQPKLRDAIIASGGLTAKIGSGSQTTGTSAGTATAPLPPVRYTGYILRNQQKLPLAISDVMDYSDPKANVTLQPKDYVRIDVVPPTRVYVEGSVGQKGYQYMAPEAGVIDAIASAGGLALPPNKVVASVRRGGQVINVDFNKALLTNDPKSNVHLENGDIVTVLEQPHINVTLAGDFNKPISLDMDPNTMLTDAVGQAGGLKAAASDTRLSILRTTPPAGGGPGGKQTVLNIDPVALFTNNDMAQNVHLQDGDVISAAEIKKSTVFVNGEVATVGPQQITSDDTLASLITRAGGPTAKAALTQITVTRNGTPISVDAYSAVKEGAKLDFKLQDGDYVNVPRIAQNIMVMEAVANPDIYPIPEHRTITAVDAISMAGGATADARITDIVVLRKRPGSDVRDPHLINLKSMQKGDWSADTVLQAGDVVYVPRKEATKNVLNMAARSAGAALTVLRLSNWF